MKKILLFGVSGLTGYKIAKNAASKYDVFGTFNSRKVDIEKVSTLKLDITNFDELKKIFSEINPDLGIYTTALHNVDFCE